MIVGGPYDPYTPRIIPVLCLYLILYPVGFILATKLYRKGKRQGNKSAQYLGWAFLNYSLAIFMAFIGLMEVVITGEFREIYRLSLPLGYSIGIVGNLCLLFFGFTLFGFQKKMALFFVIWAIITLVLVNLDSNWYGVVHSTYIGQFSMRVYSSLSMTLYAISIYLSLIWKINSLRLDKPLIKVGYNMIKWSLISFVFFWVFMTIDSLNILMSGEGFSFFTQMAWIFAFLFWLLCYTGLTMPPKLKFYIENKISKKNNILIEHPKD